MNKEELKNLSKEDKEDAFLVACFESDLKTVKYLTSAEDFPSVDIFCCDKNAPQQREGVSLDYAAENGSLEIVDYLINLPKGKELYLSRANEAFNSTYTNRHMHIIYYFIFEKNISEKTVEAYQFRNKSNYEELKALFSKKELFHHLNSNLMPKEKKDYKRKI